LKNESLGSEELGAKKRKLGSSLITWKKVLIAVRREKEDLLTQIQHHQQQ
jgi:hypothetical protein